MSQRPINREMSRDDCLRHAGIFANYLITAESKKLPVKRADLNKLLPKEYQRQSKVIINEARSLLRDVSPYIILLIHFYCLEKLNFNIKKCHTFG